MKVADLYVRVSTDEQADKGYSQRNQEEVLRKYCRTNAIEIRNVIYEDHSAKSFNRPEWKKLILNLKKYKNKIDIVLFTKWDRFSRNAGDAYQMINTLRKLGADPQAIEQPLDLSIPENKMMLAFYLAAPEVENDRRALNVFHGMRRAKKEGRYMGLAPTGYSNKITSDGRKYIEPREPDASILKWAFEELSKGIFNTEQIYHQAKEKGLKSSKTNFWVVIRNPLYCGKIFIPQYKDEESRFVQGQHEGIISEDLYYTVQDILDGRSRTYRSKITTNREFPLRGFLTCPECDKILTGSKSKGRHKYYAYYHCSGGCTYRIRTQILNNDFEEHLKLYIPRSEMKELYTSLLVEAYNEQTQYIGLEKQKLLKAIKDYESRLSHSRDLLASRQIEPSDYRDIKSDYGATISEMEARLETINSDTNDIVGLLTQRIDELLKLEYHYKYANLDDFRKIIASIFPKNFKFSGKILQTNRINETINSIYFIKSPSPKGINQQ